MKYTAIGQQTISNNQSKAFGRGLFPVDPKQAQRKANFQVEYKEELQRQIQQNKRRKDQQKRKSRQEDQRLQRNFYQQLEKSKKKKQPNQKIQQYQNQQQTNVYTANKNSTTQNKHSQNMNINNKLHALSANSLLYNEQTYSDYAQSHLHHTSLPAYEQQNFMRQMRQQKQYKYKQTLDAKVEEVYRQIQSTKKVLKIDQQLERIRRQLKKATSSNQQKDHFPKFQDQYSKYYSLPKQKINLNEKKLQYAGDTKYRKPTQLKSSLEKRNYRSNINEQSRVNNGWGTDGKKGNFLGNREALDYQINNIMNRIDNLLQK